MKKRFLRLLVSSFIMIPALHAQKRQSDSINVVKTFKELLSICKNVNFADPKVQQMGTFYQAGAYVIYRGADEKRNWKDFANYARPEEKKGVDEVCYRINNTVNQDSSYTILGYHTEKESEGTWHLLLIKYLRKGVEKKSAYAFLKIGDRFGLGDID